MALSVSQMCRSTVVLATAAMLTCTGMAYAQPPQDDQAEAVRYEDFGAVGDGKTDDLEAIVSAHAHANKHGLPVRANDQATYYIGGKAIPVVIQTDTDFGKASFIIDDRDVENDNKHVFWIRSKLASFKPEGIDRLQKGQKKLDAVFPQRCLVEAVNSDVRRYIRRGANQNQGGRQTDMFLVDHEGNVDPSTPILWDFDRVTKITAYPIDEKTLTITGGRFTTIANQEASTYNYYHRGMTVVRSNVIIRGMEHRVTGEGETGAPYSGFIHISRCADVLVKDTVFTGRKTYRAIGSAGRPVSMGSYDFMANRSVNVTFQGCTQTNDINDRTYWGVMASNYCKNLAYDQCVLSRFDAHQGVHNATITGSTLGHTGMSVIGAGHLLVEDTTVHSRNFIGLRGDYGSTWEGQVTVRNCVFKPAGTGTPSLISGFNDGKHDFGYTCHMPKTITIEGLHIQDANRKDAYPGPAIFGNFNRQYTAEYEEKFPYIKTRSVSIQGLKIDSGKPLRVSDNKAMFAGVVVTRKD